jgi:hypothetical protein
MNAWRYLECIIPEHKKHKLFVPFKRAMEAEFINENFWSGCINQYSLWEKYLKSPYCVKEIMFTEWLSKQPVPHIEG